MQAATRARRPIPPTCLHARPNTLSAGRRWTSGSPKSGVSPRIRSIFKSNPHPTFDALFPKGGLPNGPARTRFAPSPTGFMHLGGLRTALYNYLLAKKTGGRFLLRIEDTDQARTVQGAEDGLKDDLRWAGLLWNEGPDVGGPYGPYRQSERLDIYRKYIDQLLEEGKGYPGTCRNLDPKESAFRAQLGESHVVRFRAPAEPTAIHDIVHGKFRNGKPDFDFILIKSDGFPTYHFANVVDDHLMHITHVIRGSEWLISAPKHVDIYNAFGWAPPQFAHVGLLVDERRQKLSKRHEGGTLDWYKENNIPPEALLNFAVLLGWSLPPAAKGVSNHELMSLDEMVDKFEFNFTKGDIMVKFDKLTFLHGRHFERMLTSIEPDVVARARERFVVPRTGLVQHMENLRHNNQVDVLKEAGLAEIGQPLPILRRRMDEKIQNDKTEALLKKERAANASETENPLPELPQKALDALQDYVRDVMALNPRIPEQREFIERSRYYFWALPESHVRETYRKAEFNGNEFLYSKDGNLGPLLQGIYESLNVNSDIFTAKAATEQFVKTHAEGLASQRKQERSKMFKHVNGYAVLRWALLGDTPSASLVDSLVLLGRAEVVRRLKVARNVVREFEAEAESKVEEETADGQHGAATQQ